MESGTRQVTTTLERYLYSLLFVLLNFLATASQSVTAPWMLDLQGYSSAILSVRELATVAQWTNFRQITIARESFPRYYNVHRWGRKGRKQRFPKMPRLVLILHFQRSTKPGRFFLRNKLPGNCCLSGPARVLSSSSRR